MRDDTADADRLFRAYAVLGLAPTASAEEVRQAYRKAAFEHHADRGGHRAQFDAIVEAYREIRTRSGTEPNVVSLVRGRAFRFLIAPRTPGFLIAPGDPIDGRSHLVRVVQTTREEEILVIEGADGNTYRVTFSGLDLPKGQALRLQGQGEPARRGGVAGDLFLWFP